MLTIEVARQTAVEVRSLPAMSRAGLVVMAAALALDVAIHLASDGHAGHEHAGPEQLAHLLGIVGMVLVLAGVVIHGVRRQLRRAPGAAKPGGLDPNAHR